MADPRFYDNRGPFALADICEAAGALLPAAADGAARVEDLASLSGAGLAHLSFFSGDDAAAQFAASHAGYCFVPSAEKISPPASCVAIPCASVQLAFAAALRLFYPQASLSFRARDVAIDPSARIGKGVALAPGVVIGPGAEIGDGTSIGPNTVIGRGVAIGRDCDIASHVTITHAYLGDSVIVSPGTQIGQAGFSYASTARGHVGVPQIGRVIVQDHVEIGANCAIDRAALGDTVIGEGTKIDNLLQIAHNVRIGRHCVLAAQVGIAGSAELGDFVAAGGQVGVKDHVRIGNGARLAARAGVIGDLDGGQDYGGTPAKPLRVWARELVAVSLLAKRGKKRS